MKAKKENKVYTITTEVEKQRYLKAGYDIYDDKGNITDHSPLKKIAYAEYAKLQEENARLKKELEDLQDNECADNGELIVILTEYANEHEIELGKATSLSGILKKIKEVKAGT